MEHIQTILTINIIILNSLNILSTRFLNQKYMFIQLIDYMYSLIICYNYTGFTNLKVEN